MVVEETTPRAANALGWLHGWRGRERRPDCRHPAYPIGHRAGRQRRVLAQRLGLWFPSCGREVTRDVRKMTCAYLAEVGRALRHGCDLDNVLAHFPIPPDILPK